MDLRCFLKSKGMGHKQFCDKSGISRCTISRYVNHRAVPSKSIKILIEFLSEGKVTREDWNYVVKT